MSIINLIAALYREFARALDRQRGRRELRRLDQRILRDVGLTREQVEQEAAKPIWRR